MTSKDQRYTKKKRKLSQKTTHKGEITDKQLTIRIGDEELALLEMWMTKKELDMTALLEEIISTLPNEVSSYAVRNEPETRTGKRLAGGKPNKRICCWIRSTLHEKRSGINGSDNALSIVSHKAREMVDRGGG
jgi:hypothetical protein